MADNVVNASQEVIGDDIVNASQEVVFDSEEELDDALQTNENVAPQPAARRRGGAKASDKTDAVPAEPAAPKKRKNNAGKASNGGGSSKKELIPADEPSVSVEKFKCYNYRMGYVFSSLMQNDDKFLFDVFKLQIEKYGLFVLNERALWYL